MNDKNGWGIRSSSIGLKRLINWGNRMTLRGLMGARRWRSRYYEIMPISGAIPDASNHLISVGTRLWTLFRSISENQQTSCNLVAFQSIVSIITVSTVRFG